MEKKAKISAFQLAMIMYPTIVVTAILLLPSMIAKFAHRDMWLSPIWAASGGVFIVWVCYRLHQLYPGQSMIQYAQHIIGRIPGKAVGVILLLFFLQLNGYIIREFGEFMISLFFPKTPILVVMGSIVLVAAYAVRGGMEVLGRCASVFAPMVLILFLMLLVLLIPNMKPRNWLPCLENGIQPTLIGAIVPMGGWFGEFCLVSFLFPALKEGERGFKWSLLTVLFVTLTMVITNLATLSIYGNLMESIHFPVILASRYVQLADFIEHVESLVMAIWILGVFVKVSMFLYAAVVGTAEWLNLSDYRLLVLPVALICLPLSVWLAPNLQGLSYAISTSGTFYYATVQYLIPTVLLITAMIRSGKKPKAKGV
ncbi:endospore germination permease [Paenibacillus filicis]|uniref:Endospore germination permease n=1 Tax=Paenibacillus gyeongsangnamensis TaxID=3388067 RepID=A0ABT4QFJ1_9BACL|nr:endospore germination permease [Paenibacillus filicis]MCZ8515649.1 endospore germination permease [Paenibacillus filicis]